METIYKDQHGEVVAYSVGSIWQQFAGVEGCYFDSDSAGLQLVCSFPNIHPQEQAAFEAGNNTQFKIGYYGGVIWIFFRTGALPWQDIPFNVHLCQEEPAVLNDPQGLCYSLRLILVEGTTGEIKHLRLVALPERCSRELYKLAKEQLQEPAPTPEQHRARVQAIYSRYTTQQLLKFASAEGRV